MKRFFSTIKTYNPNAYSVRHKKRPIALNNRTLFYANSLIINILNQLSIYDASSFFLLILASSVIILSTDSLDSLDLYTSFIPSRVFSVETAV